MSYDRQVDQVCPHGVVEEAVFVGSNRLTIKPVKPMASAKGLVVRVNGLLELPKTGVSLAPSATGSVVGPFQVPASYPLVVRINDKPPESYSVPAGLLSASALARELNRQTQELIFSSMGQRLTVVGAMEGSQATIKFTAESLLCDVVGIPRPREYRGKDLYPPWSLVYDPSTLSDRPMRFLQFDYPLRSASDYAEISYTTLRQDCRRCGGSGTEHDWRYATDGNTSEVRDEALLLQEIQKLFLTVRGSNRFHPQYGTSLIDSVGKKLILQSLSQSLLVNDLYETFARWQEVKRKQETQVGQEVTDAEFPFRLLRAVVSQGDDPTVVTVSLTIQNRSRRTIQIERGLKVPVSIKDFQAGVIRDSLRGPTLAG